MKILFSIVLLTLFCAFTFAQQAKEETESAIVAGKGWGVVVLGAKRKTVEAKLGDGMNRTKYDGLYYIDYPKKGLRIYYTDKKDEVYGMFFDKSQRLGEGFVTAPVKTDKGVSWTSKPDDVLKAYGKPKTDFGDKSGKNAWRRIEFVGIDFLFELGELTSIAIYTQ